MYKRFSLIITVFMLGALAFQVSAQSQPKPIGKVVVENLVVANDTRGTRINFPVFVVLYKDGKAIRTTDLRTDNNMAIWDDVPTGALAVQFEARGYGKVVKRIIVVGGGMVNVRLDAMGKNDEVWGAGPSLFELQRRIETLEAEIVALKKKGQ